MDALRGQTLAPDGFEWIVVANGDPEAAEVVRKAALPFSTSVVETAENGAIAAARNLGARRARAPLLLMSDDDCLPNPEAVAGHVRAHRDARYGVAVIGPLRLPSSLRVGRRREPFEGAMRFGRRAAWINATGANTSFPRPAFEAVGGYDETFVDYGGEDPDLALRLRRHGLRFRYEPSAWAYHAGTILDRDPRRAYLAGRAHRRIFERERSVEVGLLLGVHPGMLGAKRWLLTGPLRWFLSDARRSYELAYLDGAASAPGAPTHP